ncbi:unnamed protein product [Paramecium sonneborni]|uniref:Uncharacterized protein n=1 Tax=Paramecium sonneborni TaxID=65129 RepID=A0A8S1NCR1_9CILI|nr:unnamed protein product [Paramecium sonneborni]
MKGFDYTSNLIYSYKNSLNEMKQILEFDGYNDFEIKEELNLIKYTINNQRVIKLNYLLYLFEIKYVRITVAQLIQLCKEIVQKYYQMQQNSIQHNYLHLNRVLLKLDSNQESLSILPIKLNYKVHFTGYDCPFYEREDFQNYQINDADAIKSIVLEIINFIEKYSMRKTRNDQKFQQIIESLKSSIRESFDSFIQIINEIFQQYSNQNNEKQKLVNIDQQFEHLNFKRNKFQHSVQLNLQELQNKFLTNNNYHFYELNLYITLPLMTKEFRKSITIYLPQQPPQDLLFISIRNQLECCEENLIKSLINEQIDIFNKSYKFEWDINAIIKEIKKILLLKYQILEYFYNDYQILINNDVDIIINQISFLKKNIAQDAINNFIYDYQLSLNLLQLIDDSI